MNLKNIKRICVVDTVYTLFLYYLICGINENDIFIMSSGIPESIRKNINHIYFPPLKYKEYSNSSKILKIKQRMTNICHRFYYILKIRLILFIKTKKNETEVYGHGHLIYSFPIYEHDKSYLIEDGLNNYLSLTEPIYNNSLSSNILKFFGFHTNHLSECFGTHKNIKKVYLTKNKFPEIIKSKVEVINIKELWNKKTETEKNKILKVFNTQNLINNIKDNQILLLTQCFSEDDLLPFNEEIKIYKELIENQENSNIIIKTHPREQKDYSKIFQNMTIIDKPFPLELLKCADIKINKVITVSSTAALNFMDECEIEIYDRETSSKEVNNYIYSLKKELLILNKNE